MSNPELVRAKDLDLWARDKDSHFEVPILVRRLILATAPVVDIAFGANEDVFLGGWDGIVEASGGSPFVPEGPSRWEVGVKVRGLKAKAQSDYEKRTADPRGADRAKTTFVFATAQSAHWRGDWRDARRKEQAWADVRAYGASDLETWLDGAPSVHYWISERLGRNPREVTSPDTWWMHWSRRTRPALPPRFLMAGRESIVQQVSDSLVEPGTMAFVVAPSRQESLALTCASFVSGGQASGWLRARTLIISGPDAWARVIDAGSGLVLVPDFDDPDVAAALAVGHRVVIPAGRDAPGRGTVIRAPDLDCLGAASAIAGEEGVSWETAGRHAAHARRSLPSFRRSIALAADCRKPPWSEGDQGRRLVPLLLADQWEDGSGGDRRAIEALTGRAYADVEGDLAVWSALDDPPVRRAGRSWRIVSKPALWDLLSPLITASDMARFHQVAVRVLEEPDPALDVPADRRLMAGLIGQPRTYSVRLRDSIADTVAFLAGYVGDQELGDHRTGAGHASDLVSAVTGHLNTDASGRGWQSAAEFLPLLAEASPDGFLGAVESGMSGESPALASMFLSGEEASYLGVTSPHIALVEALQVLCWSPLYLGRAAAALARLADLDPGPRLRGGIRPARALAGILSAYQPQTPASLPSRLNVIKALRRNFPSVSWSLLQDVIPERDSLRPSTRHPRWRDWHQLPGVQAPAAEVTAATELIVSWMVADSGTDASRWADLIAGLGKLPPCARNRALSAVEKLEPGSLSASGQVTVWEALTDLAAKRRQFPTSWRPMPSSETGRLEDVAGRFAPKFPADLYAGLFSDNPRLPGAASGDHTGSWAALQSVRRKAVQAVIDSDGASGLLALGRRARNPAELGSSAADVMGDLLAADLLPLLAAEGPDARVARGYVAARADAEGTGWVEQQLRQHQDWDAGQQVRLLVAVRRAGAPLLTLVRRLAPEVQRGFWQQVDASRIVEPEAMRIAAGEMSRRGRAWSAIPVLASLANSRSGLSEAGDVGLVEDTLLRAATGPCTDGDDPAGCHDEIRDLLDHLEYMHSDVATRARLEFLFAVLLDHFRPPRALPSVLQAEPRAFADLVAAAYLPDDQVLKKTEITDERRSLMVIAITALHSWHTPPGSQPGGMPDDGALRTWVFEARHLLAETGHSRVGDKTIGRVLAHAPADSSDGIWPPERVRDLIEDVESSDLEAGLLDGKIRNDLRIRSPTCGGDVDRAAATQFQRWAWQVTAQWRTAALLRQLADASEERARSRDRFSQEIQDPGR